MGHHWRLQVLIDIQQVCVQIHFMTVLIRFGGARPLFDEFRPRQILQLGWWWTQYMCGYIHIIRRGELLFWERRIKLGKCLKYFDLVTIWLTSYILFNRIWTVSFWGYFRLLVIVFSQVVSHWGCGFAEYGWLHSIVICTKDVHGSCESLSDTV